MIENKKQRGGKREGAGAKPKAPTTAIRIDNRLLNLVNTIKSSYAAGEITDASVNKLIFVHESKLFEHQDKLMELVTKRYGTHEAAKQRMAAYLGIESNKLIIRHLSINEIVDIREWLDDEPIN